MAFSWTTGTDGIPKSQARAKAKQTPRTPRRNDKALLLRAKTI